MFQGQNNLMNSTQKTFVKYQSILFLLLITFVLGSCNYLIPNKILETPKGYVFSSLTDTIPFDHIIQEGDQINLFVYSNNGYKLIDPLIVTEFAYDYDINPVTLDYEVRADGFCRFPMVGEVFVKGLTEKQAEDTLIGLYAKHYVDPFIQLSVNNKRVAVYRGNYLAKLVTLESSDMTILEVIAEAEGVTVTGKAYKIKLARMGADSLHISSIDLSEPEGFKQANTYVRSGDIISIDPSINTELFKEIVPIISSLTSVILLYTYFTAKN